MRSPRSPDPVDATRLAQIVPVVAGAIGGASIAFAFAVGVLPSFPMSDDVTLLIWYAIRVAGITAYLLLWLTTVAGLCIHYASFLAYCFALVHGLAPGTDSDNPLMRVTYLVTGQAVILLVAWRLRKAAPAKAPGPGAA